MSHVLFIIPQLLLMMHITQNITKNIIELQEESKKKNPELYRECEEVLMKIRQIDSILLKNNTEENPEYQVGEATQESLTAEEILVYKEQRMTYQIRPFIKALASKKKVLPYIYETISALMSKMVFDDSIVLELVDSLIVQLNINRDYAIKIFQLFFFVIQYRCVKGDIIINLFYALINILTVKSQPVVTNAKAMSKQIVYVIFMRFRNAYSQFKSSNNCGDEYEATKKDCKTILCDIHEFMDFKNENKINLELSLEFIEIIFKVEEIFNVTEIKEMFVRLVNKIDTIGIIEKDDVFREKHDRIIICVVKSSLFTEESNMFIQKSIENLHIFDPDTISIIFDNIHNRNTFFDGAKTNLLDQNIGLSKKYKLIYNIFIFLRTRNDSTSVETSKTLNLDTTMDVFTIFFNEVPISHEEEDNIIEILRYLISNSTDNKERLNIFIQKMIDLGGNFGIECFKLCCKIKGHLVNEWRILLEYVNIKKDMNCFNYLLQELNEFTPQEIFYVLAFIQNPEHIHIIFKRAIDIITRDLSCVITVFCSVYTDISLLCTVIDEYVMFLTEHDLESEILPFLFVDSIFRNYSIMEILDHHAPLLLFKNYNFRIKALESVKLITDQKHTVEENEYRKLLGAVHNAIRVLDNRINGSWVIIFDILQISTEKNIYAPENFKILQTISEDFYPLLSISCKLKIPGLLFKVSLHESDNINVVLQILNLIGDNAKTMNKITLPYDLWKEYLINIIEIIKKNKTGWSDIFDTGLVIIYNILDMQHLIDSKDADGIYKITYETILNEMLIIFRDLFFTKIVPNNDENHNEEKKRFKDTLILGLQKTNSFLSKITDTNLNNTFVDEYYKFVTSLLSYRTNINERVFDKWKDEIATECLKLFKVQNSNFMENYLFLLQSIPIFNNEDSKNILYYQSRIYIELLNFEFYELDMFVFMEKVERFFVIENLEIRDKIFELLIKNCKGNILLHFSTIWLKSDDKDILARLLAILKEHFRLCQKPDNFNSTHSMNIDNSMIKNSIVVDNENIDHKPINHEDITNSSINNLDIANKNINQLNLNHMNINRKNIANINHNQVSFNSQVIANKKKKEKTKIIFENDDSISNEILIKKNLMKNLTVLINYDIFWDELLCVIQLIAINIKDNFELVKYFMELAKFIFQNNKNSGKEYSDVVTLFGSINENKAQRDPLAERRREKTLVELMNIYMNVVSGHFINESGHVNDSFVELSFSIVDELSYIHSGCYRENLSGICLDLLFKYSRFTRDLLLRRIRLGLTEYVKEINMFRDAYSRVKRNEIFQILDGIIANPGLVADLKNEIIDALSSKDFNTIEKIKICLKTGL